MQDRKYTSAKFKQNGVEGLHGQRLDARPEEPKLHFRRNHLERRLQDPLTFSRTVNRSVVILRGELYAACEG